MFCLFFSMFVMLFILHYMASVLVPVSVLCILIDININRERCGTKAFEQRIFEIRIDTFGWIMNWLAGFECFRWEQFFSFKVNLIKVGRKENIKENFVFLERQDNVKFEFFPIANYKMSIEKHIPRGRPLRNMYLIRCWKGKTK